MPSLASMEWKHGMEAWNGFIRQSYRILRWIVQMVPMPSFVIMNRIDWIRLLQIKRTFISTNHFCYDAANSAGDNYVLYTECSVTCPSFKSFLLKFYYRKKEKNNFKLRWFEVITSLPRRCSCEEDIIETGKIGRRKLSIYRLRGHPFYY